MQDSSKENIEDIDRNKKFLTSVMGGESFRQAGLKAGFSTPERDAYKLVLDKRAQDYARRLTKAKCILQGMPQAYDYMYRTMMDPRKDDRLRIVCAREIMGYGGIVAPKGAKGDEDQAPDITKMKREDLIAYVEQARLMLAENARMIEQQPQAIEDYMK